ncbi:MAG: hypothetical protein DRO88_09560 [Promethearchaeia archaeon]|nr:MAG: hypothetical protein DRO88_09560 [Candidatus Lokiarchaeia archaeon]
MWLNQRSREEIRSFLIAVFGFQFDDKIASILIEAFPQMNFQFSRKTKKIKYIFLNEEVFAAYRPQTGKFSLGFGAAEYLIEHTETPRLRAVVQSDIQDFIKSGKSVFSQHVVNIDPLLHIGDEVIIVNENDELLALGKLTYPPFYITQNVKGSCIKVRKGINARSK